MLKTNIKTTEVTFDVLKTLALIGSDKDLLTIFNDNFKTDIKLTTASVKSGSLNSSSEKFIKGIFENIILKRKELLTKYTKLTDKAPLESTDNLPRRYGKVEIQKDITERGGKATDLERMLLKVNDLKNIYAKLNRKGISNLLGNVDTLTNKQCRDIIATINLVENKLKDIL